MSTRVDFKDQSEKDINLWSYPVSYCNYYEPYVIVSTNQFVPYDERFRGYGLNKCAHIRNMHQRGVQFRVLYDHFVVAKEHDRSEAHSQTYNEDGGYRKYIVAALYELVEEDIRNNKSPILSKNIQALFATNESHDATKLLISGEKVKRQLVTFNDGLSALNKRVIKIANL
jgi:hypothetical protein